MRKLSKAVGFLQEDGEYSKQSLLKRYSHDIDETENRPKLDIIREIIEQNDWDIAPRSNINGRNKAEVTLLLLYEYSTSIEVLTGGKVSYKDVLAKLSRYMGKLRYGDWKAEDSDVNYDGISVTSDEFKEKYKDSFGAQVASLDTKDATFKKALMLYDINEFGINNGIDCRNLNELRQTMFHELTHIMELCKSEKDDQEFFNSDFDKLPGIKHRTYRNSARECDGVYYTGVSTAEFDSLADTYHNGRIMHNQITEGFVENISRKVLELVGGKLLDPSRYSHAVKISQDVMDVFGEEDVITNFVTDSSILIHTLEDIGPEHEDYLHMASDRIMDASFRGVVPSLRPKTNISRTLVDKVINAFRANRDDFFNDGRNQEFFNKADPTKEEFKDFLEEMAKKPYSKKKVINQKERKDIEALYDEYLRILAEENEFFFDEEKGFKAMLSSKVDLRIYDDKKYSMDEVGKGALKIMTKNAIHSSRIDGIRKNITAEIEKNSKEPFDE